MTILTAPPPLLAGPPGQSAYAAAVSLGFTGTLAQFIASLQGQNGVGLPGSAGAAGPTVAVLAETFSGSGPIKPSTTYAGVTFLPSGGLVLVLPAAQVMPRGTRLTIADETGTCSATLSISINANGSDIVGGQTGVQLTTPFQAITLTCNGSNLWMTP